MVFYALVYALAALSVAAASSKPNFLIIVADDVGVGDIGVFGNPTIRTPNIDRLAYEGMKLTQFYSAAPLCSPSRAALITGRLPIRTGVYTNQSWPLDDFYRVFLPTSTGCIPPSEKTVAQLLSQQAGYWTATIGKWHMGHQMQTRKCLPTSKGFQYSYFLPYSHEEGFPGPAVPESLVFPPVPLMQNETIIQQPVDMDGLTPRYNEQMLSILDIVAGKTPNPAPEHAVHPAPERDQPFMIYLGYEEAHVPLFAAPAFQNKSRRGAYGDAMEQMDHSIGLIMDRLKTNGLANNTIVLFTSDNGAWLDPGSGLAAGSALKGGSNSVFRGGKGSTWEGGVREPAIVWGPNVPAGTLSMAITSMMDFMPTILQLANVSIPGNLDGKSLVGLIHGTDPSPPHDFNYYWREHTLYAIRQGPWKAHFYTRPGFGYEEPTKHDPPLLFNVEEDPAESLPVNTTTQPEITKALIDAANAHVAGVTKGVSQYEGNSLKVVPCCDKPFNETEALEFIHEGKLGLALWDRCVCSNATSRPLA